MRSTSLLAILVLSACGGGAQDATTATPPPTTAAPTAAAEPTAAPTGEQPAFITSVTSVKKEPNEEKKVTDPKTSKPVSNWVATLHRGEQVTVLKTEGEYAQVKTSADLVGWLKPDGLLPTEGVQLATVLEEVKTFKAPDFSQLNAGKTFIPGSLLFITKTKDAFSEVNYLGQNKLWVMTDKLVVDTSEVEASRLVSKARWLDERKDPSAAQFWDLAKSSFAQTKLIQWVLAQPATAAAAPTAEGATAGATNP